MDTSINIRLVTIIMNYKMISHITKIDWISHILKLLLNSIAFYACYICYDILPRIVKITETIQIWAALDFELEH